MDIYIILLIIMIALGGFDLIVGVSNDAANFLNSAIGSKSAKMNTIMLVAAIGICFGALTSTGMMEVARKGIFHPEMYQIKDLFMIFAAVMLTDVVLLDLYNSFGMPTSTTVSLVFELLGAALILALWKTGSPDEAFNMINAASALKIISGIFLSVLVAFLLGATLMFLFRTIFTFEVKKNLKKYGGIFAGLCLGILTAFILVKGMKKSNIIPSEAIDWGKHNLGLLILGSGAVYAVIFQIMVMNGINILRYIILIGTGGLAMAFAGNDLVNFIGVPMAALASFNIIDGVAGGGNMTGAGLAGKVASPDAFLFVAGLIMAATLWKSKKSQTVRKTELSLASVHKDEIELFSKNGAAKVLVQILLGMHAFAERLIPKPIWKAFGRRFEMRRVKIDYDNKFDQLRASINIVTASSIIMTGTLMKLPLSTTFVTFMVAMGTSLSDRAWGRENAVNRFSGVMAVVGGWLLTAALAFCTAGLVVSIIYIFGLYAIFALVLLVIFLLMNSAKIHKKREQKYAATASYIEELKSNPKKAIGKTYDDLISNINKANESIDLISEGIFKGKRKPIRKATEIIHKTRLRYEDSFLEIIKMVNKYFGEKDMLVAYSLTNAHSKTRHIFGSLNRLQRASLHHLENYNTPLSSSERNDLKPLLEYKIKIVEHLNNASSKKSVIKDYEKISANLTKLRFNLHKAELKRINSGKNKAGSSLTYLTLVDELTYITEKLNDLILDINKVSTWVNKKKKAK